VITNYWQGKGRKLIVIPKEVLRLKVINNPLLNQLYITDLGFYPAAAEHYTFRENGCPEMIIILCVDGKGRYETKAVSSTVLPGQFFILPPNQQHQYEADKHDAWSIFWIRIGGANVNRFCLQSSVKKCYKPVYINNVQEISRLFDDIYATLENGYSLQHLTYANMTLQHMLALLLYRLQENKKETISITNKIIHFMRDHIVEQYSLQDLALAFNYSPSQFSNIFRKDTGYSPIDYFIHLKVQQGCKLLDSTNMKIYEVALAVGYNDPYHFSKLFKKIMHLSPEQYRLAKKG
jgi:AraC family transcriptional regulator of arabinose operon